MKAREFYEKITSNSDFEWLGSDESSAYVRNNRLDLSLSFTFSSIKDNSWEDIEKVLQAKRKMDVMNHITRIVGYFSQIQNWNKSKKTELDDRHHGKYSVSEEASTRKEVVAA